MWFKDVLEEIRILNNTLAKLAEIQTPVRQEELKKADMPGLYHPPLDDLEHYKIDKDERDKIAKMNPYIGMEWEKDGKG